MEIMRFNLTELSSQRYYEKHLQIVNPFLPKLLSHKKVVVLAGFMALQDEDKFSTESRRKIRQMFKLSHGNLGNYLEDYVKDGLIIKEDSGYFIRKSLFPSPGHQGYQIKIKRNEN